jgi:type II secretory pathway pseudopilin PulG
MRRHQRGAALLIAVALLGLLAIATLARALSAPADNAAQLATERALARASDALAAYGALGNAAGNHNNSPGALPCPDIDGNDGESDFSCSGHIGRLPWKTLGMGPLLDGAGECLWYARSPTFSNNIQTSQRGTSVDKPPLNPATPGGIVEVSTFGPTGARVAAVIIAPGRALSGQARSGGLGNPGCRDGSIEQFIESATIDGVSYSHIAGSHAITAAASGEFNDSVLTLSTSRLFASAGARVLGDISLAPDGTPAHEWWTNNLWCGQVCASGGAGVIGLADGSRVMRNLPALPACASVCSGS